MSLRDSILGVKIPEKVVTLDFIRVRGKPIKVLVRGLSLPQQLELEKVDDNMVRGLKTIVKCVLDPKTKEPVFEPEDVKALEGLPLMPLKALFELITKINQEPEEEAKNS